MQCVPTAAAWARQQRLLFLGGGYFGRLIYQWSRRCSDDFITCREFLLFLLCSYYVQRPGSTSAVCSLFTLTCLQPRFPQWQARKGYGGRLSELRISFALKIVLHVFIPLCVCVPWNTCRSEGTTWRGCFSPAVRNGAQATRLGGSSH